MKSLVAIIFSLIFTGCATSSYTVKVDSIADSESLGETYVLKSGLQGIADNDLRFKEYANIVSNALKRKGLKKVDDVKTADLVIMLAYGISDPKTKSYTRSVPVYGQNNTTTVVNNSWGQQIGSFQTQQSNPYAPSGYQSVTDEVTTYDRFVVLTAYDAKDVIKPRGKDEKFEPKMAWETKVTSTGSSGDLRKVFPVMMIGAIPFFGENSGKQKVLNIDIDDEKDPRVQALITGNTPKSSRKAASQEQ